MESIRNFLKSWPGRIFLMLCLSPLLILGLESYFRGGANANEVAKVGDQSISREEYQNAITSQRTQLLQSGIESSAINTNALNKEVLRNLINRALLQEQTQQLGMHISDSVINEIILQDPQFQDQQGQFSSERFEIELRRQGINKEQLFNQYRQQLNLMQLYSGISQTGLFPESEVKDLLALQLETRKVWVHRIPWKKFEDKVTVSNNEIESYYNEHQNDLQSLAMVDLAYINLDPSQIEVGEPTEEEILAQYDAFNGNFDGTYTQRLSQILVTGDDAEQKMKDIQARLQDGENFAELAQQFSEDPVSKDNAGDIGTFNPDAFGEEGSKVAQAIQGLRKGQVSEPIKTSFGYQIFKVTDMPSVDSMRDKLIEQVTRQKQEQIIADKITRINDMATDGVGIEDIAQQEELTVHNLKDYTKLNNQTELNQPAVIEAAFEDFNIENESVSSSIKVKSGTYWVQPTNYRPVSPLSLEQASAQIKEVLVQQKATDLALKQANNISTKINKSGIQSVEVSFEELGNINRQDPQLSPAEKAVVFSYEGIKEEIVATSTSTESGATVMALGPIVKGSVDNIPEQELLQATFNMRDRRGVEQFSDYIEYLKIATPVEKNETVINEVGGF